MWADLEAFGQTQADQESVVEKLRTCLEKVCAKKLQDVADDADFPSRLSRFGSEVLEGDDLPAILDCISITNQCNLEELALEKDEWAKLARQAHDVANLFLGLFNQMIPQIIDRFDAFCKVDFFSGPDRIPITFLQRITQCIEAVGEQIPEESMERITGSQTTAKVFTTFWRQLEGWAGQFFHTVSVFKFKLIEKSTTTNHEV